MSSSCFWHLWKNSNRLVVTISKFSEHSLKPIPVSYHIMSRWESIWYTARRKKCNASKFLSYHSWVKEYGSILIGFWEFRIYKYFKSYSIFHFYWWYICINTYKSLHMYLCIYSYTCMNVYICTREYIRDPDQNKEHWYSSLSVPQKTFSYWLSTPFRKRWPSLQLYVDRFCLCLNFIWMKPYNMSSSVSGGSYATWCLY